MLDSSVQRKLRVGSRVLATLEVMQGQNKNVHTFCGVCHRMYTHLGVYREKTNRRMSKDAGRIERPVKFVHAIDSLLYYSCKLALLSFGKVVLLGLLLIGCRFYADARLNQISYIICTNITGSAFALDLVTSRG